MEEKHIVNIEEIEEIVTTALKDAVHKRYTIASSKKNMYGGCLSIIRLMDEGGLFKW